MQRKYFLSPVVYAYQDETEGREATPKVNKTQTAKLANLS